MYSTLIIKAASLVAWEQVCTHVDEKTADTIENSLPKKTRTLAEIPALEHLIQTFCKQRAQELSTNTKIKGHGASRVTSTLERQVTI